MCFIFSVGRLWWYPTMSFKIAQSNLNSDGALPLCIPILLGWPASSSLIHPQGRSCVKLPLPTCFQVLHHSSHGLGRSPCLSSYFLIQYPRCGSQLCHLFGPVGTCPTFSALQSGLLCRWGSWKYCWPLSIVLNLSSVLVANTSEVFKYRAHAAQS